MIYTTGYGWEVTDLTSPYGADVELPWAGSSAILNYIDLDIATMTSYSPPLESGRGEILTNVALLHQTPSYSANPSAYIDRVVDSNFGIAKVGANPQTFKLIAGATNLGIISSVILKFPITKGIASTAHRHVLVPCNRQLLQGDVFVFHADYMSSVEMPMDLEMQMSFNYTID